MSGPPYDDLGRPPLDGRALAAALTGPAGPWRELRVVAETGSTQADLALAAQGGAGEGLVLVAERQRAGRGRLDRSWVSPPRAGLTFSVLLRPGPPEARWGWLSLLGGVAVAVAVQRVTGAAAAVKWPNDVLVEGRKLAGVLAERVAGAVVLGVGLNVSQAAGELPGPAATSLALEGVAVDRHLLLAEVLGELAARYRRWPGGGPGGGAAGLRAAYLAVSATVGRPVRVALPGGGELAGRAVGVDEDGCLRVRTADGPVVTLAAGDVVHLRDADPAPG